MCFPSLLRLASLIFPLLCLAQLWCRTHTHTHRFRFRLKVTASLWGRLLGSALSAPPKTPCLLSERLEQRQRPLRPMSERKIACQSGALIRDKDPCGQCQKETLRASLMPCAETKTPVVSACERSCRDLCCGLTYQPVQTMSEHIPTPEGLDCGQGQWTVAWQTIPGHWP